MWFRKKELAENKIANLQNILISSFQNVKRDTSQIFQWLDYLYQKNIEQEHTIKELQLQLQNMPITREEIRRIVDDYYSYDNIIGKINDLNTKVDGFSQKPVVISHQPKIIKQSILKEKLVKRLTKNSKDYIKNAMISLIRKYEKISAFQLKEIIVEEQSLCSKSSFYRLLAELENTDEIAVIIHGREKIYAYKVFKKV